MRLGVEFAEKDGVTPWLSYFAEILEDLTPVHVAVAGSAAELTRTHLLGLNRHKTATKLGASPTFYWERMAESIEHEGVAAAAYVRLGTGDGMGALARVLGPVKIQPRPGRKYLTLSATAAAYGRRAGEFKDLKFIQFAGGRKAMLAKVTKEVEPGKRPGTTRQKIVTKAFYWLRRNVTLSEDRTLIPSDEAYLAAAEAGAKAFYESL